MLVPKHSEMGCKSLKLMARAMSGALHSSNIYAQYTIKGHEIKSVCRARLR